MNDWPPRCNTSVRHPPPTIKDLPLLERFQGIEKLDKPDRDAVLRIIDAVIKSHEHESIETRQPKRVAHG